MATYLYAEPSPGGMMTTFRTAAVYHPRPDAPDRAGAARFGRCCQVDDVQAQANRMHVRMLLKEKQPDFAAMLGSVAREFTLAYMARKIGRSPDRVRGRRALLRGIP
jgi:hypothetical protein